MQLSKSAFAKAVKAPEAFIDQAVEAYAEGVKAGERGMVAAVQATQVARAAGIILNGRNNKTAGAMTTEQFALKFGVGNTNVTLWAALATYLDKGGSVDSELWGHLVHNGISGDPKAVLVDPAKTLAQFEAAWAKVYRPDGSRRTDAAKAKHGGKRKARPNSGVKPDVTRGKGLAEAVEADAHTVAMSALTMLSASAKRLTDEQFASVETALNKIITREVTIRRKAAEAASKAASKPRAASNPGARKARKRAARKAA